MIEIDLNTGLRANQFCSTRIEARYYRVYPLDGLEWAMSQGIEQPPAEYCPSTHIVAGITSPMDGSTVRGTIALEGAATAANFSHYQVELGVGTGPQAFAVIRGPVRQLVEQGVLGVFDTTEVENGPYTLRMVVYDQSGGAIEARTRVLVDNPVSTATPSPSPTATATQPAITPTGTPTPTDTPTPTLTPIPVELPTNTPTVTLTPTLPAELPTNTPPATATTPPELTTPTATVMLTSTVSITATPGS